MMAIFSPNNKKEWKEKDFISGRETTLLTHVIVRVMDNDLDTFPVDEASLPRQFTILGCDPVHSRRRGDFRRGRGGRGCQSLYGVYIRPEIKVSLVHFYAYVQMALLGRK